MRSSARDPLPFFTHSVDSLLADRLQLSASEFGIYVAILLAQWRAGAPLPKDKLARFAGVSSNDFAAAWPALSGLFEETASGVIQCEVAAQREWAWRQRENKRAGNAAMRVKTGQPPAEPTGVRTAEPSAMPTAVPPATLRQSDRPLSPSVSVSESFAYPEQGKESARGNPPHTSSEAIGEEFGEEEVRRSVIKLTREGNKPGDIVRLLHRFKLNVAQVQSFQAQAGAGRAVRSREPGVTAS